MHSVVHDVVVVGAGPAGSRVARDLALRGFDVLVLEDHPSVGSPCHCSGLVSPRTLTLAAVGEGVIRNTIRGALIHVPEAPPVRIGGNRTLAFAIDRPELDRRLATQAAEAGAHFLLQTRFVRFSLSGDARGGLGAGVVEITTRREGVETQLRARLLVGADGARSLVADQVRGAPPTGDVVGLGAVAHYDRNDLDDHVEVFFDPHSAPGWFGWTIPLGGGMARIGTGSGNGIRPRESLRRLSRSFPDTLGTAEIVSRSGGLIALWHPTPMVADRLMLVGDAARQVKPTSGGGIYAALEAASILAEVAAMALDHGDLSHHALRQYPHRWHSKAGRELRRQHDVRRALNRLTAPDVSALLRLLEYRRVRKTVNDAADIDFPTRVLGQLTLRRPDLLAKLIRVPRFPMAWIGGR